MNQTHRSCAEWPEGTLHGGRVTTDLHYSREEAQGVCDLLSRNGYGGEKRIMPIRTWVESLELNPDPPDNWCPP